MVLWSEHVYMLKGHESGNHDWVLPFHAPSLVVISIKINLDKVLTLNRPALFIETAGRGNPYQQRPLALISVVQNLFDGI